MVKIMKLFLRISFVLFFGLTLISCTTHHKKSIPVVEEKAFKISNKDYYVAQAKDTVYSIAWAYAMDFRDLALLNNLAKPYHIKPGDKIRVSPYTKLPLAATKKEATEKTVVPANIAWQWPLSGKVTKGFSFAYGKNKGIDLSGKVGEVVKAAAKGKVVYSGNGLRAYGNLLIIKHNDTFLSAYAYNSKLLVKEGALVKAGAKVALVGRNDQGMAILHFEIRQNGKPINPLDFLPARNG
jgi:lipoprotein NlpD